MTGPTGSAGPTGSTGPTGASGSGSGDVVGPSSATDNAVVRFDTTTGKLIQNSSATLSDLGALTLVKSLLINNASQSDIQLNTSGGTLLWQITATTTGVDLDLIFNASSLEVLRFKQDGTIQIEDGGNFAFKTTTGTKIGTATSQKLAFFNSTPIVQPSGNALTALSNLGLIATPTLTSTNVGLGNVDNTSNATERAATATLTNKRITPRVNTVTSSATPSINTDTTDVFTITALATAITSMTTNLSGTPTEGQKLIIRILDNGTARAITWGASFASRGATLPTTTTISKYTYVGLLYNNVAAKWDCVAAVTEA